MERVKIDENSNSVVLTFNGNFYPKELIEQAVSDFHEVCDSRFEDENLVLKPKNNEVDITNLGYEFYNYVLGLIKS